jgi:hypothetical protein
MQILVGPQFHNILYYMQLTTYCTINTILYFVFFFNFKLLSNKKKFHNISVLYAIEYILYNKRNFFVFCFFSNYYKIYRLIFHDWRFNFLWGSCFSIFSNVGPTLKHKGCESFCRQVDTPITI